MSTYEATIQQAFTATHALPLPAGGQEPPHKHTWVITATFRSSKLDETMGVVIDFVLVQDALADIARDLEGTNLNDLDAFVDGRASAERVAKLIAERLIDALGSALGAGEDGPQLDRLEVTEAPGCSAAYLPNGQS